MEEFCSQGKAVRDVLRSKDVTKAKKAQSLTTDDVGGWQIVCGNKGSNMFVLYIWSGCIDVNLLTSVIISS